MSSIPPSAGARTSRCPDEAQLAAYFERRLEDSQQEAVEAHVSGCERCLATVAFLLEAEDAALPEVPRALLEHVRQPVAAKSPWVALAWKWSPAAAALAGVVVVASLLIPRGPVDHVQSDQPVHVGQAPQPVTPPTPPPLAQGPQAGSPRPETRSQSPLPLKPRMLEPKPGATVASGKLELRWAAVPQALFYDVRITDPRGQLVWSSKVEQEQVEVPAEAGLKPGSYFVWVRAHLPEGKLIRTEAVSFAVRQ